MTARAAGRADMRGFPWTLGPLERKLEHDLELAQAHLAALCSDRAGLRDTVRTLRTGLEAQLDATASSCGRRLDPSSHTRSLRYLAGIGAAIEQRQQDLQQLDTLIAAAKEACSHADRNIACVRRLRESAQAAYAGEQLRREARQADLAWLARSRRLRVAPPRSHEGAGC